MTIGIIADSPLLTSGFGVEAYQVATALAEAGHDVACFGLKGDPNDDATGLPFRIRNVNVLEPWNTELQDFLLRERPAKVIILIDLFNLREIMLYLQEAAWTRETIVFLTPDGLPAYDAYLDALRAAKFCVVTTETTRRYLTSRAIVPYGIAPSGVDRNVFIPMPERDELRRRAGLSDRFVIGVFGRNCERKQQPRVLQALALLADPDVVVYFHCNKQGYWRLDEVARDLGVGSQVIFSGIDQEERGVPTHTNVLPAADASSHEVLWSYGYVQRMNCCDVVINAAHSGDVEHIILEAQSCGIPLLHTDDQGIMREAVGDGGRLLQPADTGWGRIGERIYMVDPSDMAQSIRTLKDDPALRSELQARGFENVKKYSWSRLREIMVEIAAG